MLLEEKRTCLQGNHISSRLYKSILIIVGPSPRAAGQEPKRGGVSGLHLEPLVEELTLATALFGLALPLAEDSQRLWKPLFLRVVPIPRIRRAAGHSDGERPTRGIGAE